jgi:hypothetical protein
MSSEFDPEEHDVFDEPSEDEERKIRPGDETAGLSATLNVRYMEDAIVREVAERLAGRMERAHIARVEEAVDRRVVEICERELDDSVRRTIANGWHEPSRWGERTERVTLDQRIAKVLGEDVDNYSRGNTRYKKLMQEAVDNAFSKELRPLLDKAKEEFKQALDDGIKQRLADALKGAFGLR